MTSELIRLKTTFDLACYIGTEPLPLGDVINEVDTPGHIQTIGNVATLETGLQELLFEARENSLNSPDMPFREVMTFAYADGEKDLKSNWTTSNLYRQISFNKVYRALTTHPVLDAIDAGEIPDEIINIHTHPATDYRPAGKVHGHVLMSAKDITLYQDLATFFFHYAGQKEIPVRGIVYPVGKNCGNVVIEKLTTAPPPKEQSREWSVRAERLKDFRQAQRDFGMER